MLLQKATLLLKTFAMLQLNLMRMKWIIGGKNSKQFCTSHSNKTSKKLLIYKIPEKWRLQNEILKFTDQVTPN